MEKLKSFIDGLPCGLIGTLDGYNIWKYEASENTLDNYDYMHLNLKLGETYFNTEEGCITGAFKDLDTFEYYKHRININLDLIINIL